MLIFLAGPLAVPQVLAVLNCEPAWPAHLPGVSLVGGDRFALPRCAEGHGLDGCLARCDTAPVEALCAALGWDIRPVTLSDGHEVAAALPPRSDGAEDPWDAADWERRFGRGFATALPQLIRDGASARPRLAMIFSQTEGLLRAGDLKATGWAAGPDAGSAETRARSTAFAGFFSYDLLDLRYPRLDGRGEQEVRREVFRGTDATLILPYDPKADTVLLVEQFRAGAYARGDAWPWMLEPVAGLVDAGETPAEAAVREASEEAGIEVTRLIDVGGGYPSPGITSEFYHLFVGLADLSAPAGGGLAEEGEDIRPHVLPFSQFDAFLDTDGARVLPLLTLGLWLRGNRTRLRESG